ncbi:MAG: hypothetical protein AAGI11_06135 [Pseudomonadota bacterium]
MERLKRSIAARPGKKALNLVSMTLLAFALSACGPNQVVVEGNFPDPLMSKMPMTLGVWYPEEFRTHEFFDEAKGRRESGWIVKTGDAQVDMWNTLFNGMFREVVLMRGEPGGEAMNQVADAVLIPSVDELQYTIPAHTNVKVYEIWMRYKFDLVTMSGEPIANWTMTAYGKTPTAFLRSDEAAVNLAAIVALRDAGANFATNFAKVPEVGDWLAVRGDTAPVIKPELQIVPVDVTEGESVEEAIEEAVEDAEEEALEQAEENAA